MIYFQQTFYEGLVLPFNIQMPQDGSDANHSHSICHLGFGYISFYDLGRNIMQFYSDKCPSWLS